eukprot:gene6429-7090_t
MTTFIKKLEERVAKSNSLLCIGLDPHVSQLPEPSATAAAAFCSRIIQESHPYAAAFKPNSAFFECFGAEGFAALQAVIKEIPSDIPVILDCKRGDIDTTAAAYASSAYDVFGADCVTLNPYMGWDSIKPFVTGAYEGKGAFVLCKTSNPSSAELQQQRLEEGSQLFEVVLKLTSKWNENLKEPSLGFVAGATDLDSLGKVRASAPEAWILCPGVGAQGGEPEGVCRVGLRQDGSGLLVSVSRAISKASDIAKAASTLRDEINVLRENHTRVQPPPVPLEQGELKDYQREFLSFALAEQALRFGSFKLKSGRQSPYFFNAGNFCSGKSLSVLGLCYARAVRESGLEFDVIFGPAYKGIPLAAAFSTAWLSLYGESKEVSYNRKEAKDHGEGGVLVGASLKGRRVLIIDDVITAGTAIREAVDILHHAEANIVATVVCLDRQERASEDTVLSAIQQVTETYGFPVFSIVQLRHLIAYVNEASQKGQSLVPLEEIEAYRAKYGATSV